MKPGKGEEPPQKRVIKFYSNAMNPGEFERSCTAEDPSGKNLAARDERTPRYCLLGLLQVADYIRRGYDMQGMKDVMLAPRAEGY